MKIGEEGKQRKCYVAVTFWGVDKIFAQLKTSYREFCCWVKSSRIKRPTKKESYWDTDKFRDASCRIADLKRKLDSKQEEYDKEREQNRQKFAEKENMWVEFLNV